MNQKTLSQLLKLTSEAGEIIMKLRKNSFDYVIKKDSTPITYADKASHEFLVNAIEKLTPKIPILSEESSHIPFSIRKSWKKYWLIDPLDGTTNFSNGLPICGSSISFVLNYQTVASALFIPSIEKIDGKCISWSKDNGILIDGMNFLFKENSNISFVPGYLYSNTKLIKKYKKLNFLFIF